MNILYFTYFINGFLMIAMPIGLTVFLTRKFKRGWRLFWIGAATFIFSQVFHIPFNALVNPIFNRFWFIALPVITQTLIKAIFLGLSAGLFEELCRYGMYRWAAKDARSWGGGLLAGSGHGGAEAIILGALALYTYIQMVGLRYADLRTVVPPAQIDLARTQILAFWSTPWYLTLFGAVERLFSITIQLACSLLVLQVFIRKQIWWVGLAIFFHALLDGVAVFLTLIKIPAVEIEGVVGIFAVLSMIIIISLHTQEPMEEKVNPKPIKEPGFIPKPFTETKEDIEKTRFQ